MKYDVIVIGGGPSGMASALEAIKQTKSVLLIERENILGGILNQCIHNGFGLKLFKEELTGPEYALRLANEVKASGAQVMLGTFVTDISGKKITIVNIKGTQVLEAKAIVFACGAREKTAGQIWLPGKRLAGIYTAGNAQKMINHLGYLPGKRVVILGSGDIGLIMARRLTLEGAKVLQVLEIMCSSSGLKRNIRQCIEDFNIPILYNHTITNVVGKDRIEGISYAQIDEKFNPIKETEKFIKCDALLLSVGLIPENELISKEILISPLNRSAVVDEYRQTSESGLFITGNVLHIHDLADNASIEGKIAGKSAGLFAKGNLIFSEEKFKIAFSPEISYTIPQIVNKNTTEPFEVFFRVKNKFVKSKIQVKSNGIVIAEKFMPAINPGEMAEIEINPSLIKSDIEISILS